MVRWSILLASCLACSGVGPGLGDGGDAGSDSGVDPCSAAACSSAADNINSCCQGTITRLFDGPAVCAAFAPGSSNPVPICQGLASPSCSALHDRLLQPDLNLCCCAALQRCDPQRQFACATVCRTSADCTGDPARPACAPIAQTFAGALVIAGVHVCKPDDGQPYDGCTTTHCSGGYDCATDGLGNHFCTLDCVSNDPAACGDQGIACCNATGSMGSLACGVCTQP
jgi:hypothetical protein